MARADRGRVARWWEILDAQAHESAEPLNPQLLFHELCQRLPDDAILTSDSGSRHELVGPPPADARGDEDRAFGDAGHDVPRRAVRAGGEVRVPRPARDRGDRRRRLPDARHQRADRHRPLPGPLADQQLVVAVLHNDDLNQVTWEQRVMSGDPKLEVSQALPDFPYARYARAARAEGHPGRPARRRRAGLGRGAGRGPARADRGDHRPRGAAAAAAHPLRAGQGRCAHALLHGDAIMREAQGKSTSVTLRLQQVLPRSRRVSGASRRARRLLRRGAAHGRRRCGTCGPGGSEDARGHRGAERAAARRGDVPRALQGLVRRPLDVEPDRAHAAAVAAGVGGHAARERRRATALPAAAGCTRSTG